VNRPSVATPEGQVLAPVRARPGIAFCRTPGTLETPKHLLYRSLTGHRLGRARGDSFV